MRNNKKSNKYINLFLLISTIIFQYIMPMEYNKECNNSQDLQQNNNDNCNDNKLNILIDLAPELQFYIMSKLVEMQTDYKKDDINNHIVIKRILCNLFSTCKYFKQFDNKKDINYIIANIYDLLKAKGNENYKFNTNKLEVILYKIFLSVSGDLDCLEIKKLILSGADVNIQDRYGDTTLIIAAKNGYADLVKLLIAAGANINVINNSCNTALIYAVKEGHKEIAKLLITAGADINIQDKNGYTALMLAAIYRYQDIIKLLLRFRQI